MCRSGKKALGYDTETHLFSGTAQMQMHVDGSGVAFIIYCIVNGVEFVGADNRGCHLYLGHCEIVVVCVRCPQQTLYTLNPMSCGLLRGRSARLGAGASS